ncbi:MAG: bacteriochlorophyll 4-vinyl reductase [Myxococcota bacterium]
MSSNVIHIESRLDAQPGEPKIGPNSVFQTLEALRELEGSGQVQRTLARTGLATPIPESMIPERWFLDLIAELRRDLPRSKVDAILSRSGSKTAAYVSRRRIPTLVRFLLRVLPTRVSLPILLEAIRLHAWTFAGAGDVRITERYPYVIEVHRCPTCRGGSALTPSGGYYAAAFEGLLRIVSPKIRVREHECVARGSSCCRFIIRLDH